MQDLPQAKSLKKGPCTLCMPISWQQQPSPVHTLQVVRLWLNKRPRLPAGTQPYALQMTAVPSLGQHPCVRKAEGALHRQLPLADRATMVPLLYAVLDFEASPSTYERYDRMSALELFTR